MEQIILANRRAICQNEEAALLDLGDGVACLEFRSKGNSISPAVKQFTLTVLADGMSGFDGLVIGSQAKHFSVGANLAFIRKQIEEKNFNLFELNVGTFQAMTTMIKCYHKPIVAAPYRGTLGGGLEIALHAHARVALSTVAMGLVEVGVGLLPGGGGTKELALLAGSVPEKDRWPLMRSLFETLLTRGVSTDAEHAKKMHFLKASDVIVSDPADLIAAAKEQCLRLIQKGTAPPSKERAILPGKHVYEQLVAHSEQMKEEGVISPFDHEIGKKIARIFAGGDTSGSEIRTETQLLELERRVFVELAQTPETYARICYFLENNKMLRN